MTAIALDTNILLLLLVARATGQVVGKRLKAFTNDDIAILNDCLSRHDRLVTTPNVWTEISNTWSWGIEGDWRDAVFATFVDAIEGSVELVRASKDVLEDPEFGRLGLTDCVWLAVLDAETTLITDDLALYNIALSRGLTAVNFTHLREFA